MQTPKDFSFSDTPSHAKWELDFFVSGRHLKWPYPLPPYPLRFEFLDSPFVRVFWLEPNPEALSMKRRAAFTEIEFVTLVLTKSDEKAFVEWHGAQKIELISHLATMVTDGYKLSFSHDFDHDCFIVACTGTKNASDNVGRCFTSRAGTVQEACWLAVYKHYVVCDGASWGEPSDGIMSWG